MWCKSVGFVRWLVPLLILRSVGFLFYVLSVCSLFAGCLLGLQLTYLYPQFLCELFRLYIHLLLALLSCGCFYFYRLKFTEFIYKSSNGDLICCKFLVLTCVYISVVLLLLCPNNSCIYLRSVPLSNRCVA